ncbi:MAG TPA: DNA polymerase III subunit delta, partial [Acidiferrobacterales bacterium]
MRVDPERLAERLAQGLAPVYLVTGDEPLLVEEAGDAIRRAARSTGYLERRVLSVEAGFDWGGLYSESRSLSLFAERRLLELRLPTAKPGDKGAAALIELAETPPPDTVLLVVCGKLEKAAREAAWVRAIDAAGVVVTIWPLDAARLPAWIAARLKARKLRAAPGAVELLAHHMEGNLLACAQEIDKLAMTHGEGEVGVAELEEALSDNARFTVFGLVDTCLKGDAPVVARQLASLRAEGVEPVLVLWALARELRALAQFAGQLARGGNESAVLSRVWAQRRGPVRDALRRLKPASWLALVARAARIDR